MEEEILHSMIKDREEWIEVKREKLQRQDEKYDIIKKELNDLRKEDYKSENEKEISLILDKQNGVLNTIEGLESEVRRIEQGPLDSYIDALKEAHHKSSDDIASGFLMTSVLRKQALLCRAIHSRVVWEKQIYMAHENKKLYVKNLEDNIKAINEEKSQIEVQNLSNIVSKDDDKQQMIKKYESKIENGKIELYKLRKLLSLSDDVDDDNGSKSDDHDDDDISDEDTTAQSSDLSGTSFDDDDFDNDYHQRHNRAKAILDKCNGDNIGTEENNDDVPARIVLV